MTDESRRDADLKYFFDKIKEVKKNLSESKAILKDAWGAYDEWDFISDKEFERAYKATKEAYSAIEEAYGAVKKMQAYADFRG